ncbi:MAG: MiaB/RimO family radical SAM methylthiotransferase [Candidatus Hydrothermales bacterium]
MKKISIVTLGCPKNQVDSEYLAGKLTRCGFELVGQEKAKAVFIMTCAFIEPAVKETEEVIKKYIELKRRKKIDFIAVGGCYVHRFKESIKERFKEVDLLFGFDDIEKIDKIISKRITSSFDTPKFLYNKKIPRAISTVNYAYLKISEGCDENCTFCIIPLLRGKYRSKPIEKVLYEAKELLNSEFYEIILISQSTGLYGIDLYKKKSLKDLLKKLLRLKNLKLLRIFYLHPADLDEEIMKIIVENEKIAPYLDIPIQHVSEEVLRKMKRRGGKKAVYKALELIEKYKNKRDLTVRTEIIVGFPEEQEKDFEELYEFCKRDNIIKRWALFKFYGEKESFASQNYKQLEKDVIEKRYDIMEKLILEKNYSSLLELVGKKVTFIPEYKEGKRIFGHTEFDAPEIDVKSYIESEKNLKEFNFKKLLVQEIDSVGFKLSF